MLDKLHLNFEKIDKENSVLLKLKTLSLENKSTCRDPKESSLKTGTNTVLFLTGFKCQ